ncbi:MAG: AhpC/TSA family protein [Tannerella sp.]|jgi:peroxiredoxin|nr:AhpC/TSA family protein [Tannerella sp.]
MKNKFICRFLTVCCLCIIISGCGKPDKFTVKGIVAGATGQTLYLENTGLSTVTPIDSFKLKPDGKFLFKQKRPEYPDFYRLKLKNQTIPIHFSIDSTETVTFIADAHSFATSYTVEGSENSKAIKEITLAQMDANQEIHKLRDSYGMNLIPDTTYQESALKAIKSYKDIALKYIFGAPASPTAYFALFQQIDGLWFFDLYDRTDSKAYGAVATSYKAYYPESPRSKQLESLALQSLRVTRGERRSGLNLEDAKEVNFIDIDLPNINNSKIKLSDIVQGKAVLVVFTAYQTDWSPAFNIKLNELYNKYKERGFDIYQVSLDSDMHFWKNVVSNIPWTSVRDPQSVYSSIAAIYNVRQLPALFLINKKGEMSKRIESIEAIENDIKSVL